MDLYFCLLYEMEFTDSTRIRSDQEIKQEQVFCTLPIRQLVIRVFYLAAILYLQNGIWKCSPYFFLEQESFTLLSKVQF